MITLFAFLYLYSQILFNKIAIISYQKKKKIALLYNVGYYRGYAS